MVWWSQWIFSFRLSHAGELSRINLDKSFSWKIIFAALMEDFRFQDILSLKHQNLLLEDFWGNLFSVSGLIWHGGLIGGFLAVTILVWIYQYDYLQIYDIISPFLLLGQAFGRMGCFLAGERLLWSSNNLPWGMRFPEGSVPTLNNLQLQKLYAIKYTGLPIPNRYYCSSWPAPLYHIFFCWYFFFILWKLRTKQFQNRYYLGLYLIFCLE